MYESAFIAHHAVELVEGVLDGRAGEEDALLGGQGRERDGSLGLLVLEPVRLIADQEAALKTYDREATVNTARSPGVTLLLVLLLVPLLLLLLLLLR